MNNKLYVCTYYTDTEYEIYCGSIWANHYEIEVIADYVTFYDVHNNVICIIANCNTVREVYKG